MVERLRGRAHGSIEQIIIHRQNGKYLPGSQLDHLLGQEITQIDRYGKYIIFYLATGDRLISHNSMSGFWDTADNPWTFDYVEGKREANEKHLRVSLHLKNGTALCFHDARLFGSLRLFKKGEKSPIEDLGPDAAEMGLGAFFMMISEDDRSIKEVLMDQSLLAGVGNIYSSEALWLSGVDPEKPANKLSRFQSDVLILSIKKVFTQALEAKLDYGWLKVYRQKMCASCGGKIKKKQIAKRSTYYCDACQK